MKYIISYENPQSHYVDIEFIADKISGTETLVQLPAWRPGRYELGNFSKNIQRWSAFDEGGNVLAFSKQDRNTWKVNTKGVNQLHVRYNYYAAEINAGSSFLDESQLYMNPVNCCVYIPGRLEEKCEVDIMVPDNYKLACGLRCKAEHGSSGSQILKMQAADYHELADSPFIASPTLLHNMFVMDGVEYHLWFQGECKPDWPKLINDFFIFINEQFLTMKEFPVPVYHFIFQVLPFRYYHGVEHLNSTVIALGPSYNIMRGEGYEDLLGVSSHELFHAWNVKNIRPSEMLPYDYSTENYSRQGFVYEGVTTYYGDLFLLRSGVFSEAQYFKTFNQHLQKHFDNPGRFNMSVADASFDTWVDGYVQGIPDRKTNIYDEGCLTAFIIDILIRENSGNRNSLDDVMRLLFYQHAKNNMGYSEKDYLNIVNQVAGTKLDDTFRRYIYGKEDYTDILNYCLDLVGLQLLSEPSQKFHERSFGFKVTETGGLTKVTNVLPGSIAFIAGLRPGDEIISVNGFKVNGDLNDWCSYFEGEPTLFFLFRSGEMKIAKMVPLKEIYYKTLKLAFRTNPSKEQLLAYHSWSKRKS